MFYITDTKYLLRERYLLQNLKCPTEKFTYVRNGHQRGMLPKEVFFRMYNFGFLLLVTYGWLDGDMGIPQNLNRILMRGKMRIIQ